MTTTTVPAGTNASAFVPARRKHRSSQSLWLVAAFTLPALILMAIFLLYPVVQNVRYSLYDWNGISPATYRGLANYRELIDDTLFRAVFKHTLELAIVGTAAAMAIGLGWAYAIERRLPGWRTYRFLLFIPVVMPIAVSGVLWSLLLEYDGPVNQIASDLGWSNPPVWLGDPKITLWVVVAVSVWQSSGFTMLLILGGMEDVPRELHEAASLDGIGPLRRLTSIIVPHIRGTLAVLTVLQFIALLKAFDIVFAMTAGGPGNASDVMGTYLYEKSFVELRWGYGSAVAVVMTLVLFVLSFGLYRRLLSKETE